MTITLPKFTLFTPWEKKKVVPRPEALPPIEVETPAQELVRLLDRVVHEHGRYHVDTSHRPTRNAYDLITRQTVVKYGCIMGQVIGLKGVSAIDLRERGLDHYIEKFGWSSTRCRNLIVTAISMNDSNHTWGMIQDRIHELV